MKELMRLYKGQTIYEGEIYIIWYIIFYADNHWVQKQET